MDNFAIIQNFVLSKKVNYFYTLSDIIHQKFIILYLIGYILSKFIFFYTRNDIICENNFVFLKKIIGYG